MRFVNAARLAIPALGVMLAPIADAAELPKTVSEFIKTHCLDCHDASVKKGGLD